MVFNIKLSFINGLIAGAGIVLSIISIAFLKMTGPLEGKMGVTTTEIRVAIVLGFAVFAVAILYEFYRRKNKDDDQKFIKNNINQNSSEKNE